MTSWASGTTNQQGRYPHTQSKILDSRGLETRDTNRPCRVETTTYSPAAIDTQYLTYVAAAITRKENPPKFPRSNTSSSGKQRHPSACYCGHRNMQTGSINGPGYLGGRGSIASSTAGACEASTANMRKPWVAQGCGARLRQRKRHSDGHFLLTRTRFHPPSGLTLLVSSGMDPSPLCAWLR